MRYRLLAESMDAAPGRLRAGRRAFSLLTGLQPSNQEYPELTSNHGREGVEYG
jgi:hypothetical protein